MNRFPSLRRCSWLRIPYRGGCCGEENSLTCDWEMTLNMHRGKGRHLSFFLNKMGDVQHFDFLKCEAVCYSGTTLRGNIPNEQRFWTKGAVKFYFLLSSVGAPAVTGCSNCEGMLLWFLFLSVCNVEQLLFSHVCSLSGTFWTFFLALCYCYELILASSRLAQVWDRLIATCFLISIKFLKRKARSPKAELICP